MRSIEDHFGTVSVLYDFFKLTSVKEQYCGRSLKRLIETRRSGHFVATKAINENSADIVQTLTLAAKIEN